MPLPTQYIGNYGQVAAAKEATFGVAVASTDFFPIESESLETDPGVTTVPTIRGTRAENNTYYLGEYKPAGPVATLLFPSEAILLTAAAIGSDVVTGVGPYTHTMAPNEAGIPSLTLQKSLSTLKSLQYVGSLVTKASYMFDVAAPAKAVFDFVCQNDTQITPTTGAFGSETPYALSAIAVTVFGSPNTNVISTQIDIDNGVNQEFTFSGFRYSTINYSGKRVITGKVKLILQSMTDYSNAVAGTPGNLIVACTSGTNSATFTLNNIIWGKPSQPLVRGQLITQEIPFTAYYLGGTADLSVVIVNTKAAAYV